MGKDGRTEGAICSRIRIRYQEMGAINEVLGFTRSSYAFGQENYSSPVSSGVISAKSVSRCLLKIN